MSHTHAELSSLTSNVDEVTARIGSLAESAQRAGDETSSDLYEIERTLRTAQRRLHKLLAPTASGSRSNKIR